MTVFVVLKGEKSEGGSIEGVYSSVDAAREAALATATCFGGGWVQEEVDYWTNGCDFISVQDHPVQ